MYARLQAQPRSGDPKKNFPIVIAESFELEYWDPDDKWVIQGVYNIWNNRPKTRSRYVMLRQEMEWNLNTHPFRVKNETISFVQCSRSDMGTKWETFRNPFKLQI